MSRTFLIARQEFIKYVTRRGFFISIAMFPLWIVVVMWVPQITGGNAPREHVFTVVDRTGGGYANLLYCAPGQREQQRWLSGAEHYARTYVDRAKLPDIGKMFADPQWPVLRPPGSPQNLRCGPELDHDAIEAALRAARKPGAPAFIGGKAAVELFPAAAPGYLIKASPTNFPGAVRRAWAEVNLAGLDAGTPLDTVIVIPVGFGRSQDATAEIWTSGRLDPDIRRFVQDTLVAALRLEAVRRVAPQVNDPSILDASVDIEAHDPDRGGDRSSVTDSIVPIALAIILFVVSVMNSSVLLQGVVEEKSTRMIEVLLSCATPREITTGKLIGVIGVALTTLIIWALALFAMTAFASHETVSLVFSSLRAIVTLQTTPLLLLYFLCGLLIYGSLFLAIGSMANSLADAQSLLGPSMLILMLPNLMIAGVMRDPNGPLATTLSWVPIYTPFFMMLRIASHPPVWQLWGTAALAVVTTGLMILWTGRIFAKHVLTTERPPALRKLIAGLFTRAK